MADPSGIPNTTGAEREFETGKDEAWHSQLFEKDSLLFANRKRTYDEYQHESLADVRGHRSFAMKTASDAGQNDNVRQSIANQALQNAVETANMVGKSAIRHTDLAVDRQWNIDEVSDLSAKTGVQSDAMVAMLAKAVAQALSDAAKPEEV
jgi:hypothetical protein